MDDSASNTHQLQHNHPCIEHFRAQMRPLRQLHLHRLVQTCQSSALTHPFWLRQQCGSNLLHYYNFFNFGTETVWKLFSISENCLFYVQIACLKLCSINIKRNFFKQIRLFTQSLSRNFPKRWTFRLSFFFRNITRGATSLVPGSFSKGTRILNLRGHQKTDISIQANDKTVV